MKKFLTFSILAVAILMIHQTANATIWRVNNNPGKSGVFGTSPNQIVVFANLTEALRELNNGGLIHEGDTIHLEGSVTPYGKPQTSLTNGNCDTIAKQIVLIGPGYLLNQNTETQHFKESAKIRTIHIASTATGTIIAGIEQVEPVGNTTTASGVAGQPLLSGYSLLTPYKSYSNFTTYGNVNCGWGFEPLAFKLRIEADYVTVTHCKLFYVDLYNVNRPLTNITITKCFFNPGMIAASAGSRQVSNLIISNNFFRNDWFSYGTTTANNAIGGSFASTWYYVTIDFRYWDQNTSGNVEPWRSYNIMSNTEWAQIYNVSTASNFVRSYNHVLSPIIQNNTFYNAFSIQGKGCVLYNNLFFPKVNYPSRYGLPQDNAIPHVLQGNIVYGGTGAVITTWTGAVDAYYTNNYGGMMNDGNNSYSSTVESNWWMGNTTSNPNIDNTFRLGTSSPARSSDGVETKQRGMYGGLSPYALSVLYTIPAVWEITIPSYPSGEVPSTGFEVRVRVKSH